MSGFRGRCTRLFVILHPDAGRAFKKNSAIYILHLAKMLAKTAALLFFFLRLLLFLFLILPFLILSYTSFCSSSSSFWSSSLSLSSSLSSSSSCSPSAFSSYTSFVLLILFFHLLFLPLIMSLTAKDETLRPVEVIVSHPSLCSPV